ncbi:MAG TPA: hypothetical protein VII58_07805 [Acidobacteriaceae bacterium]
MRNKLLLTVFAMAFCCEAARAQIAEVYVTSSNLRASNVPNGSVGNPAVTRYDTFWASGIGGGVTLNFIPLPVVSLGLDVRGSTKPGATGADTALVGLKLGVHPPLIRIKPYIQGSVGYVATRLPSASNGATLTNKYLAYEVLGGIDYPLIHFLDLRVIEIGGGGVVDAGSSNTPNLFTVNSGLVLHF